MRNSWLFALVLPFLPVRISTLRRLWRLPFKHGMGWFFATEVGPDFYQGAGAPLLRRYRHRLFAPFVLDAIAIVWVIASDKAFYLLLNNQTSEGQWEDHAHASCRQ